MTEKITFMSNLIPLRCIAKLTDGPPTLKVFT